MDYISEAEALSEIYDGFYGCGFVPYSRAERREYVNAKSRTFKKSDIGKFVVVQKSRYKGSIVKTMFLVDRNKTKRFWWSHDSSYAMVFEKESAARTQAAKYHYNKVSVKQITPNMADRGYFKDVYE